MNILRRGEIAGVLCLLSLVLAFIFSIVLEESIALDIIELVIYLFTCVTYFLFLLAVQSIVTSFGDVMFVRRMRDFIGATIVGSLIMTPLMASSLVPVIITQIFGLLSIVIIAIFGIVSIRLAPFFNKFEGHRTHYGKRAARWLKISGWLMATVILSFIGVFASLIADFYMWRLVKSERLASSFKIVGDETTAL